MITGSKYLNLAQIAAGTLVISEHGLFFPRWRDTNREIEIRIDTDRGFASFYDGLGLPILLQDLTENEVNHMHNYIQLSIEVNNRLKMN